MSGREKFGREEFGNEAVEAAAKAIFAIRDDAYDMDEWEDLDSTDREVYECQARAALEAAAPLIQAEALEEAAQEFGDGQSASSTANVVHSWLRARAARLRQP